MPLRYLAQFAVGLPLSSLRCVKSKIVWNASHGKTAVAPKLSKHAIWWVSLAEAELTIKFASDLRPSLTNSWCMQPTANRALIESLLPSGNFSFKWIITSPFRTAATTFLVRAFKASLRFDLGEYCKSKFFEEKYVFFNNAESFLCERTGDVLTILRAWSFDSSKIFNSGPKHASNDITLDSLKESMGGFVTWANCCLKKSYIDLGVELNIANAVSSPMEPVPSRPSSARGLITDTLSSLYKENSFDDFMNWECGIFLIPGPSKASKVDSR